MAVYIKRNRFPIMLYKELDYIQSTGTQYINTEYRPNQDTKILMDAQIIDASIETKLYFGCRGNGKYYELFDSSSVNDNLYYLWNTKYSEYFNVNYLLRRTVEIDKNTAKVDGITKTYTYTEFQVDYPLFLGADNNEGTASHYTPIRIYSCKIYDNGMLVRDYIPVQIIKTKEIGLWDKVEKKFYGNSGDGEFIGVYKDIPIDYTVLKYIYSDGNQYIDTEYMPNDRTKIIMDAQWDNYTELATAQTYFRCKDSENTYGVMDPSSVRNILYFYYCTEYSKTWDVPVGNRRTIVVDRATATIDGITQSYNSKSFQMETSLFVLASNENGNVGYISKGKIFSFQIYENDVLIRDYIPCMKEDATVGLLDKIKMKFYGNSGSGSFIAGR